MEAVLSIPVAYRWVITLLFVAVLITLSVTPGVAQPEDNIFAWLFAGTSSPVQKAMHVVCYALLTMLWMWTLTSVASIRLRAALAVLLAVGLGAVLEWYQTQVPGRVGSALDVALNIVGAALGLALGLFLL